MFKWILDIIAPKKCYSCKKEWHFLCRACLEEIGYFEEICPVCKQYSKDFEVHFYCKKKDFYLQKIIILTHYKTGTIKKLIKDAKFYHKKAILEDIWEYLWELLLSHSDVSPKDMILIPTPMYKKKQTRRGYNQSEILCKSLQKHFQLDYNTKYIKKTKDTLPQSRLSKIQRLENLKDVFMLSSNTILDTKKTYIIVDDVVSTGTTLLQIAEVLSKAWVKNIYGLVVASD